MSQEKRVLWADDEIDLLRPHIIFLSGKGYDVTPVSNGDDAITLVQQERYDVVLLDEMMPGRGGLETLTEIQNIHPDLPVIMITKSEEEHLMEEAIGQRIRDYLTKPVNPSQIHLALKRIFEGEGIRKSTLTRDFVRELPEMGARISGEPDPAEWLRIGERLARWDLMMDSGVDEGLRQTYLDQKREANGVFCRFVESSYAGWVQSEERPLLSTDLMKKLVFPRLASGERVAFILIDCMRLDLWMAIRPMLEAHFDVQQELYYSILPTATPYSRNSIFAGLFPREIHEMHPQFWHEDPNAEGSLNRFERELLDAQIKRSGLNLKAWKYQRAFSQDDLSALRRQASTFASLDFTALVFNFLDILAHGRSESEILKELAPDETSFRKLLETWFSHSTLYEILVTLGQQGTRVVITTDHGAILVNKGALVNADREASSNLRYKYGSNLRCDPKQAVLVKDPHEFNLPRTSPTKNYLFAKDTHFFVYPNNFHHYEQKFRDTFQHGGISIEEMVLPCAVLTPR